MRENKAEPGVMCSTTRCVCVIRLRRGWRFFGGAKFDADKSRACFTITLLHVLEPCDVVARREDIVERPRRVGRSTASASTACGARKACGCRIASGRSRCAGSASRSGRCARLAHRLQQQPATLGSPRTQPYRVRLSLAQPTTTRTRIAGGATIAAPSLARGQLSMREQPR